MTYFWIRWLGVFPAALIAFLLSIQMLRLIHNLGSSVSTDTLTGSIIWNVLVPIISYATFTFVGMRVAPSRKRLVGILLFITSVALAAFQITGLLIERGYSYWNLVFFGSGAFGSMLGAFLEGVGQKSRASVGSPSSEIDAH